MVVMLLLLMMAMIRILCHNTIITILGTSISVDWPLHKFSNIRVRCDEIQYHTQIWHDTQICIKRFVSNDFSSVNIRNEHSEHANPTEMVPVLAVDPQLLSNRKHVVVIDNNFSVNFNFILNFFWEFSMTPFIWEREKWNHFNELLLVYNVMSNRSNTCI